MFPVKEELAVKKWTVIALAAALLFSMLTGCGSSISTVTDHVGSTSVGSNTSSNNEASNTTTQTVEADFSQSDADMFTNRDYETNYHDETVSIELNGNSVTASSDSVQISGTTVTITQEATYVISGTLNNGMIIVDANESAKLQLVLNGATISSETSAALYILEADKVFVTLADGTENALSNGGAFETIDENNIDGAVYSKQDLTFNGAGSLTVTSPAGHGIVCKDDLVFTGGTYTISSASHGLDANDSVRMTGAKLTISSGKDGIHCENNDDASLGFIYASGGTVKIEAEGDGIAAGAYLQIEDGIFDITAGGGAVNGSQASSSSYGGFKGGGSFGHGAKNPMGSSATSSSDSSSDSTSMKGIKSANSMLINGGTFTIDSADDSIHSDASVTIHGGTFDLASGDDAIHAEEILTVTDCVMSISESYEGLEALEIYISGGEIVLHASDDGLNASGGTDSSGMAGGRDGMFGGGMGRGMSSSSNGKIEISGGKLTIYASGDGLDANGTLTISGGYTYVANPTSGDTSVLDSDSSPVITGGTFISTGSTTMMAQSFASSSTQGVIACTTGTQQAGSTVTVQDADGNVVISYDVEYTCVLVIISSPDLVKGETYTLTIGSVSGDITAS